MLNYYSLEASPQSASCIVFAVNIYINVVPISCDVLCFQETHLEPFAYFYAEHHSWFLVDHVNQVIGRLIFILAVTQCIKQSPFACNNYKPII